MYVIIVVIIAAKFWPITAPTVTKPILMAKKLDDIDNNTPKNHHKLSRILR